MENLIFSFLIVVMIGYFTYKATKIGLIDDAIKFVKCDIFKVNR